jgi:hypothetical protein
MVEHQNTNASVTTRFEGPLFVLSVWRSGSSLLYTLLNQHSQIALLYEADLPRLHRFLSGGFQTGAWRERWEFWNQGPSRHGIAIESMPAVVPDAWKATRIVYQDFARRKQAIIWGEKTPHWFDCPMRMAGEFPDARFIFLWRDVNAILKSVAGAARTERFFQKAGFTQRVLVGNENLRRASEALKARGRPVHEINYEDLTSNPSESMRQICRFLDVPFEERMISIEGADRSAIATGLHHTMVRSDRIVGQRRPSEVLHPALRAKIGRYICRWKRRSNSSWPKYPLALPAGTRPPSFLEIWRDQIVYQAVVGRDRLVAVIYASVPIGLAHGLRSWLRQRSRKGALLPISR